VHECITQKLSLANPLAAFVASAGALQLPLHERVYGRTPQPQRVSSVAWLPGSRVGVRFSAAGVTAARVHVRCSAAPPLRRAAFRPPQLTAPATQLTHAVSGAAPAASSARSARPAATAEGHRTLTGRDERTLTTQALLRWQQRRLHVLACGASAATAATKGALRVCSRERTACRERRGWALCCAAWHLWRSTRTGPAEAAACRSVTQQPGVERRRARCVLLGGGARAAEGG
jgi:hypothetical protein